MNYSPKNIQIEIKPKYCTQTFLKHPFYSKQGKWPKLYCLHLIRISNPIILPRYLLVRYYNMMNPFIWVPATAALVYRAYSRNSLTPGGIVAAVATAIAHALHPWSVFFVLLVVFFLAGSAVTKV
jgi:hypothetical protein